MNSLSGDVAKPSHEQTALRAELLWKAKGSPNGQDEQIWLEAERQLYDEAKEVFGNSASSPEASARERTQESPQTSSGKPESSMSAEKMTSKSPAPKPSARRK